MVGLSADDLSRGDEITPDGLAVWKVTSTNASIGSEPAVKMKGVSEGVKGQTEKIAKRRINLSWSRANNGFL